jgi:hypothetical protein
MGRPPVFNPELGTEICRRIADGESLRSVCKDPKMPCCETVRSWLLAGVKAGDKSDPYAIFLAQYARAREDQGDSYAEKVTDLAEAAVTAGDRTIIEGIRVAIDALKWAAGKRRPKVYGDKMTQEVTGADGAPLRVVVEMPPE